MPAQDRPLTPQSSGEASSGHRPGWPTPHPRAAPLGPPAPAASPAFSQLPALPTASTASKRCACLNPGPCPDLQPPVSARGDGKTRPLDQIDAPLREPIAPVGRLRGLRMRLIESAENRLVSNWLIEDEHP